MKKLLQRLKYNSNNAKTKQKSHSPTTTKPVTSASYTTAINVTKPLHCGHVYILYQEIPLARTALIYWPSRTLKNFLDKASTVVGFRPKDQ